MRGTGVRKVETAGEKFSVEQTVRTWANGPNLVFTKSVACEIGPVRNRLLVKLAPYEIRFSFFPIGILPINVSSIENRPIEIRPIAASTVGDIYDRFL